MNKINKIKLVSIITVICICLMFIYGNNIYAVEDKNDETLTYEYDESGRVIRVIYADGSYTTYSYDLNGNITEIVYKDNSNNSDKKNPETEESEKENSEIE